jgi:hypothetical protein
METERGNSIVEEKYGNVNYIVLGLTEWSVSLRHQNFQHKVYLQEHQFPVTGCLQ